LLLQLFPTLVIVAWLLEFQLWIKTVVVEIAQTRCKNTGGALKILYLQFYLHTSLRSRIMCLRDVHRQKLQKGLSFSPSSAPTPV